MKNVFLFILFIVIAPTVYAQSGYQKGTIEYLRVHEEESGEWAPPTFWFTLNGVNDFGSCKTWNGNVLLVSKSYMSFSMVLSAQNSDSEIAVRIEDNKTGAGGFCRAVYITLGKPPILK